LIKELYVYFEHDIAENGLFQGWVFWVINEQTYFQLKAPLGQVEIWSFNSSVVALSTLIHGFSLGLYTLGRCLTQFPACMHFEASHTTVISPLLYSLVLFISFIIVQL